MKLNLTTKTAYIVLVISIVFEQIGTGLLEASHRFTLLQPTVMLIIAYIISYWLFAQLLQKINLSISYATWTAGGTISAALIGFFAYHQVISVPGWIGIFIMCVGIFILNLYGDPHGEGGGNQKAHEETKMQEADDKGGAQ